MVVLQSFNLIGLLFLQLLVGQARQSALQPYQLEVNEYKITQNNDTNYVRRIMRLSKSAEMRNYMKNETDLCDDFHEFSCGNWAKINPAGEKKQITNFFDLLSATYDQKQLRFLLEGRKKSDSSTEKKVKDFFEACLNRGGIQNKKRFKLKLREIISEFGEMPALVRDEIWEARKKFDWLETVAKIQHKYGLDIILQAGIRRDFNSTAKNKLFIGQPSLKLETRSMYLNKETEFYRLQYLNSMKNDLMLYLDMGGEKALATAQEILNFEKELAKGLTDQRSGITLHAAAISHTVEDLKSLYQPTLDLEKYLKNILGFEMNETFYEYAKDYQENLVQVIQNSTDKQMANYIFYQLIRVFFYNIEETKPLREKVCLTKTKAVFAKVLDNTIFRRFNNQATEEDVNLIWSKIKKTFQEELESEDKVSWMSEANRKTALEKLKIIQLEINSYAKDNFSEEFAQLSLNNRDYIHNIKTILNFETKNALKSLHEPAKKVDAGYMLSYSPAYIASENVIKIPVQLLQPNYLWSDHYPNAVKFGTLGYLIAHELIHGFDDMGRFYDAEGNSGSWWDENTTQAFNERKLCFKNQYSRYRYGGKYLPESELQSENIADNGAIRVAYTAYNNWLEEVVSNATTKDVLMQLEILPKMNFSHKQLFFISFAQFWCDDVDETLKQKVSLVDVHAPAKFRVVGPLANFEEFSKEFNCLEGTTMNPKTKCLIY